MTVKKSLAKKITGSLAVLYALALITLFVGSYLAVSSLVMEQNKKFSRSIASIYADTVNYEAEGMHFAVDESFSETADFLGEYVCTWYGIDYTYLFVPDPDGGTMRILSFAYNRDTVDGDIRPYTVGDTVPHVMTKEEIALLENEGHADHASFLLRNELETVTAFTDPVGSRVFVGVGISLRTVKATVFQKFTFIALALLLVFSCLVAVTYLILRKSVLSPTQKISAAMTAFLKDGKPDKSRLELRGNDEFAMISDAFNSMTDDIDTYVKNIRELNGRQQRQQTELDIAAGIQAGFLSPAEYVGPDYEIHASMIPAKDIGGDLYDYCDLGEGRLMVTVADVSGKGISAALYMSITLMLLRQYAQLGQTPGQILENTNNTLSERNPQLLFATAFVGIVDCRTHVFSYANAGHNVPYRLHDGVRRLDGAKGTLLGLYPGETYPEAKEQLYPGDTLFLFTDGINEAVGKGNGFFGNERLEAALGSFVRMMGTTPIDTVNEALGDFCQNAEQNDDRTMLTVTVGKRIDVFPAADAKAFEKIKKVILRQNLPRPLLLNLCVAAEEIFVNICSYAFENRKTHGPEPYVRFTFSITNCITMQFEDNGIPYDPRASVTTPETYDMENEIGGLGKLIAFTIADKVDYCYEDGKNKLTLIKNTEVQNS